MNRNWLQSTAHPRYYEHGPIAHHLGRAFEHISLYQLARDLAVVVVVVVDLSVLVSRHVNDRESLDRLLRPDGKAIEPLDPALRPHPNFLARHRENVYKT